MHIADGALTTPVMIATNLVAVAATTACLPTMDQDDVPRVGVMASVFFLASFIHIGIGPSSVHLLLNGFLGLLLGWAVLPALAVALFLQAVLLGYGGLTSLGANILGMGLPALLVGVAFSVPFRTSRSARSAMFLGGLAGAVSVVLTCAVFAMLLHVSDPEAYATAIKALVVAHVPIVFADAMATAAAVAFLHKVRPDFLR